MGAATVRPEAPFAIGDLALSTDGGPDNMSVNQGWDVPDRPRRPQVRAAALIGGGAAAVLLVGVLNAVGAIGPYRSNTSISPTEKTRIASYFLAHDSFRDHHARAGCPVDVLGAHRDGAITTAYTVIHCWTAGPHCGPLSDATAGVVARLIDGKVTSEQFDDGIDYAAAKSELSIYPRLLRSKAFGLIDGDGPASYNSTAMIMAGCPPG
jgi:hypothetical protein